MAYLCPQNKQTSDSANVLAATTMELQHKQMVQRHFHRNETKRHQTKQKLGYHFLPKQALLLHMRLPFLLWMLNFELDGFLTTRSFRVLDVALCIRVGYYQEMNKLISKSHM